MGVCTLNDWFKQIFLLFLTGLPPKIPNTHGSIFPLPPPPIFISQVTSVRDAIQHFFAFRLESWRHPRIFACLTGIRRRKQWVRRREVSAPFDLMLQDPEPWKLVLILILTQQSAGNFFYIRLMFKSVVKIRQCVQYDGSSTLRALFIMQHPSWLMTWCILSTMIWSFKIVNRSFATFEMWIPFKGMCPTHCVIMKGFSKCFINLGSSLLKVTTRFGVR